MGVALSVRQGNGLGARRNAAAAQTPEARQRLADRSAVLGRWEDMSRDLAARLAEAQAAYDAWERATAPTRDRAVTADAELRRRYPGQHIEPLRAQPADPDPVPAEPRPEPAPAAPAPAAPAPAAWPDLGPRTERIDRIAAQLREIGERLDESAVRKAREASERAAGITSTQIAVEDPEAVPADAWKPELQARHREAVRREPMPRVPHARALAAEIARVPEMEAAN